MAKIKYKNGYVWTDISPADIGAASPDIIKQGNKNPNEDINIKPETLLYIDNTEYTGDKDTIIKVESGNLQIPVPISQGGTGAKNTSEALVNLGLDFNSILKEVYPIGSIYISTKPTNPQTWIAGTTWQAIPGRFLVGIGDNGRTDSQKLNISSTELTGGEAAHTLQAGETPMRTHYHGKGTLANNSTTHRHSLGNVWSSGEGSASAYTYSPKRKVVTHYTATDGSHSHTISGYTDVPSSSKTSQATNFSVAAHNNLPPYLGVYMWERIA